MCIGAELVGFLCGVGPQLKTLLRRIILYTDNRSLDGGY